MPGNADKMRSVPDRAFAAMTLSELLIPLKL
jgi:hypothetical protein